jgi:hypothetical protein
MKKQKLIEKIENEWDFCIKEHRLPIFETRGVNYNIPRICDFLWDYIRKYSNVYKICDKGKTFVYRNIDVHSSSNFCNIITELTVKINSTENSCFYAPSAYYNKNSNLLENVKIQLSLSAFDREEFENACSHELMHASDCYQILRKNNATIPQGYQKKSIKYSNGLLNLDIGNRIVNSTMYTLFQDEMSANLQSLYDYIITHKEINRENYKTFVKNTDIYFIITTLKENLLKIEHMSFSHKMAVGKLYQEYTNEVGGDFKKFKTTYINSFKRFKSLLEYSIIRYERKKYKVIYDALEHSEQVDESRKVKTLSQRLFDETLKRKSIRNIILQSLKDKINEQYCFDK